MIIKEQANHLSQTNTFDSIQKSNNSIDDDNDVEDIKVPLLNSLDSNGK